MDYHWHSSLRWRAAVIIILDLQEHSGDYVYFTADYLETKINTESFTIALKIIPPSYGVLNIKAEILHKAKFYVFLCL